MIIFYDKKFIDIFLHTSLAILYLCNDQQLPKLNDFCYYKNDERTFDFNLVIMYKLKLK